MRGKAVIGVLALISVLMVPPAASGADRVSIRASLEGRQIAPSRVADFYCHDFDYPHIRCFRTPARLERAVARRLAGRGSQSSTSTLVEVAALNYVKVFEHASFAGNYAYFSADYPDLRAIGWNDKISSYKGVNSGYGTFYEHIDYTGKYDSFCCNESVSYVGDTYNDIFSAVRGRA